MPKQTDEEGAEALERPPAVLPGDPLGVALQRRCRRLRAVSLRDAGRDPAALPWIAPREDALKRFGRVRLGYQARLCHGGRV